MYLYRGLCPLSVKEKNILEASMKKIIEQLKKLFSKFKGYLALIALLIITAFFALVIRELFFSPGVNPEVRRLKERNAELQSDIQTLKDSREVLTKDVEAWKQVAEKKIKELEEFRANNKDLENRVASLISELNQKQDFVSLEECELKYEELQKQCNEAVEKAVAYAREQGEKELSLCSERADALQNALSYSENRYLNAQAEISKWTESAQNYGAMLDEKDKQIKRMKRTHRWMKLGIGVTVAAWTAILVKSLLSK